jgi:acyl-homoserine-lactone acylase
MKKNLLLCYTLWSFAVFGQPLTPTDLQRCQSMAAQVTIIRDHWGIPHVYGRTDAATVFGLLFAQAEDDFQRIEMNYIEKLGRLAEVKGEKWVYHDLQLRLLIDSTAAIADYQKAPNWLKKLLNAHADALNFFLHTHPDVKPLLLHRFQPWYPLLWTDGSIGAISTSTLTVEELHQFYGNDSWSIAPSEPDMQTGSNGFAFAPSVTTSGNAILYINPHTSFYYRPEVHVESEEGLHAYGAVTWGQFFIYQGFNAYCGWMHTSSNADVSDMYAEQVRRHNGLWQYRYDGRWKPVEVKNVAVNYRQNEQIKTKSFKTYWTHHGPVMAQRDSQWISLKSYNRSMRSLMQSWLRTKAKGFKSYQKVMNLSANTSNNTVFADKFGNIAYWHGNFMPKRSTAYNWGNVVDGTTSATEWGKLHKVAETVHSYNPPNGWLQNCNSTPYTSAGVNSPKPQDFKPYMAPDGENFRGVNAVRLFVRKGH